VKGTLAAPSNYALTYVPGTLTIDPRPITITAADLSRPYGDANPTLTYAVGGDGLVNGDTLSGALATPATPASNAGVYAITQGTLNASSNYAVTFVPGALDVEGEPVVLLPNDTDTGGIAEIELNGGDGANGFFDATLYGSYLGLEKTWQSWFGDNNGWLIFPLGPFGHVSPFDMIVISGDLDSGGAGAGLR
jgi:hypothetical protein